MNRTLTLVIAAAAVVGTTGGVVAATMATGPDDEQPAARATDASSPSGTPSRTPSGTPSGTPTSGGGEQPVPSDDPPGPGRPGDLLWANQRLLHDGDTEIEIDLDNVPYSLERAAGGWVVTVKTSPQEPSFEAIYLRPDGTRQLLGETFGDGDVSPDGTRYVAQGLDDPNQGYTVWDVASGEQVDGVLYGTAEGQTATGHAQFVDDSTVATGWRDDRDVELAVASHFDGSDDRTVLADDLVGAWSISPDGIYIAGTVAGSGKPGDTTICAMVMRTSNLDSQVVDCSLAFPGLPSWSTDSNSVLAEPTDGEGDGPVFQPLAANGTDQLAAIQNPPVDAEVIRGAFLDEDVVAILTGGDRDGDPLVGTEVWACDSTGCEGTQRLGDDVATAVLGRQD
ncbi:hypothetical protein ABFT23_14495 [Nocardioides sp. C4-1]|uniref:hypothetical protein n=1 Tax=Nocardioides sp. C4-1 TaxID=3151851 RepID=UPI0032678B8C